MLGPFVKSLRGIAVNIRNEEARWLVRPGLRPVTMEEARPERSEPSPHPRILAMAAAARFYGAELDPAEYRGQPAEEVPSAAALSLWSQNAGLWARAVRLRWRQLMRL